jgi:hypothetical protein
VGGAGAVYELGRARKTSARGKAGKGRRTRKGEQRGEGGIYPRRESGKAHAGAYLYQRALNLGGQTPRLRLYYKAFRVIATKAVVYNIQILNLRVTIVESIKLQLVDDALFPQIWCKMCGR